MAEKFAVPWTLSDVNEFGIPFLPWYFTYQEAGIGLLSTPLFYFVGIPMFGGGLVNLCFMAVGVLILTGLIASYKEDKPPSWLWDLLHATGIRPQSRGVIKSSSGIRWLSAHHQARPSVFLAGKNRAGQDLTASNHVLTLLQPAVTWRPLMVPRKRRRFTDNPSPAPPWFYGANGFEDSVNPRIPVTVVTEIVDHNAPASVSG